MKFFAVIKITVINSVMKIMPLANIINVAFKYVVHTCKKYNIDESHSLKHSMDVFHFANKIYDSELSANPYLLKHQNIIAVSAIVHDMCDKKYMNEQEGICEMKEYMKDYVKEPELEVISNIISTMSYSKVKLYGYPELHEYQMAYHIVREADLLSAYDIDRCIIYGMMKENLTYDAALIRALELFEERVLKYRSDNLFVTDYSKLQSEILHNTYLENVNNMINMI
jgi:hypothetical protein